MKKFWIWLLIAVLAIGAVVTTVVLLVKNNNSSKKTAEGIYIAEAMIDDEYDKGDDMFMRFTFQDDKEFTAIKYAINNGEEQTVNMKAGSTEDNKKLDVNNGEFYASTGTICISTTELPEGVNLFKLWVTQGDVTTLVYDGTFKLVA